MSSFMMAMTINPGAKKAHPDLSHQVNESLEVFAKNKVKVISLYATLGRFDYIMLWGFSKPRPGRWCPTRNSRT
jgi:uncharacterized protein with GYD domain